MFCYFRLLCFVVSHTNRILIHTLSSFVDLCRFSTSPSPGYKISCGFHFDPPYMQAKPDTRRRQKFKKKSSWLGFCVRFLVWADTVHITTTPECRLNAHAKTHNQFGIGLYHFQHGLYFFLCHTTIRFIFVLVSFVWFSLVFFFFACRTVSTSVNFDSETRSTHTDSNRHTCTHTHTYRMLQSVTNALPSMCSLYYNYRRKCMCIAMSGNGSTISPSTQYRCTLCVLSSL